MAEDESKSRDHSKLRETFRASKAVLKDFERRFEAENAGRTPNADDFLNADDEKIRVCYKNCRKIKAYFERKRNFARSNSAPEPSTAWGQHVLKEATMTTNLAAQEAKVVNAASLTLTKATSRTSLKKKKAKKAEQRLFFDTLSNSGFEDEESEASQNASALKTPKVDPLLRLDPELSLDGFEDAQSQPATSKAAFSQNDIVASSSSSSSSAKDPREPVKALSFLSCFDKSKNLRKVNMAWLDRCEDNVKVDKENNADLPSTSNPKRPRTTSENAPTQELETSASKKQKTFNGDDSPAKATSKAKSVETSDEDRLRKKIADGNFVKINLKKKVFVRGKKTMTGAKYRRMEWKRKMAAKEGKKPPEKISTCYKCGEEGHFARQCIGGRAQEDGLLPQDDEDDDEDLLPTLEDAAAMVTARKTSEECDIFDDNDEELLLKACQDWKPEDEVSDSESVPAYFTEEVSDSEAEQVVVDCLQRRFGFKEFREGQKEAILRVLRGQSTLVLLPTGAGKSLVYQLPAFLYGEKFQCITLVVSPLVSLMEDQVRSLPKGIRAACLHSHQPEAVREKVMKEVQDKQLHFLLISPETLSTSSGERLLKSLPSVAFACIDEAHCVSQWSHNFRPAYIRICRLLRNKIGVKTLVGLTATAPRSTVQDISRHLCVTEGIIRPAAIIPQNLVLSVSKDGDRDGALIKLLQEDPFFSDCESVIVYCTRREQCDRLAVLIRTSMQMHEKAGKRRKSTVAEAYHAGLTSHRRKSVQTAFMSGQLRIVVATVAFGMGIDKADIRAVVHFNLPKTFESYVQEIGRAGRDGKEAHCHLFLDSENGRDLHELRRHIHANSVDDQTVRKLLDFVFSKSFNGQEIVKRNYKEVAVSISKVVEDLDMPEENVATLLCHLESEDGEQWLKLLNPVYCRCKIRCYGGPKQLKALVRSSPPIAAALAYKRLQGEQVEIGRMAMFEFAVVEMSSAMGWDSGMVKRELKALQWNASAKKKSGVLVEFDELAFHFEAFREISDEQKDKLNAILCSRIRNQETRELAALQRIYRAFSLVAQRDVNSRCQNELNSQKLKTFITEYFNEDVTTAAVKDLVVPNALSESDETRLREDIKSFVLTHDDFKWNGRAVARVFHGIDSPNFPAKTWGKVRRFWRCHSTSISIFFVN